MRRLFHPAFAALALVACGCKASAHGPLERRAITAIKHHLTVGNRKAVNPLPATPATLADGKSAFGHYCVACHGIDGQKTGVPFAERMDPPVPSLTSPEVQGYSDGQLKWVIDNGVAPSGMPASRETLSDDEIWSIVYYLRHLPSAGSVGEPEMYSH